LRNTSSKAAVNLLSRSWIRKRIRSRTSVKPRFARLLKDPGSGRIRRATGKVDTPAPELDEDEHIETTQRDRLDHEEVAGEQART